MPSSKPTEVTRFLQWFQLLANTDVIDLAGADIEVPPPPAPAHMLQILHAAKPYLPLKYQQNFIEPLITNFGSLLAQEPWNAETYAGAIYQHLDSYEQSRELHCFLAVVSNLYRSFFIKERAAKLGMQPLIKDPAPPLATFKYKPDGLAELGLPYFLSAFTIPADEVERVCGGKVGIVSLPSIYRKHPILWGLLAHETGGHDVLHTDEDLLPELQTLVLNRMTEWAIENGYVKYSTQLGELWQYWTEETASDVYGVLNMGPSFGFNLVLLITILNYQVGPFFEMVGRPQQEISEVRAKRSNVLGKTPTGRLQPQLRNWSGSQKAKKVLDADLDTHAVEILRLFMIIGVVKALEKLPQGKKDRYAQQLTNIGNACLGGITEIELHGWFQTAADTWHSIDAALPFEMMRDSALEVGRFLASTPLERLNNHGIQEIQTWDEVDDKTVQEIKVTLLEGEKPIGSMGDDTQLLAGGTLALWGRPNISDRAFYKSVNKRLLDALAESYTRDVFWGKSVLHIAAGKPVKTAEMIQQIRTNILAQYGS
jgi:hypothetical protein